MTIAVVFMLLSLGLCGTGLAVGNFNPPGPLIVLGLVSFYAGALLLVIGLVWMIVDNTRGGKR
jgi:hypothetical protein